MAEDHVHPRDRHAFLRGLALGCFLFYLGWNVFWLSRRQIPPSILLGVFGVAAPTTGMTRSMIALGHGQLLESLRWNPFALPVSCLFVGSLALFFRNLLTRRQAVLPRLVVWAWGACLLLAWGVKLLQGPAWW